MDGAEAPGTALPEIPYWSMGLADSLIAGRTGRGIGIAVLDSGVNRTNPHVGVVERGIGIGPTGRERSDFLDRLGHGTAVTAAIQEKAPEAEIFAIKVFHEELATTLPGLLGALNYAVEQGVRIINLSLGTSRPEHQAPLEEVVGRCLEEGLFVVSPREHRGQRWWPGSTPGVVGVLLDRDCPRNGVRLIDGPDGRPVFRASGYPRPIRGVPRERNLSGISFATANVTGLLARLIEGTPEIRAVEEVAQLIRASDPGPAPGSRTSA